MTNNWRNDITTSGILHLARSRENWNIMIAKVCGQGTEKKKRKVCPFYFEEGNILLVKIEERYPYMMISQEHNLFRMFHNFVQNYILMYLSLSLFLIAS